MADFEADLINKLTKRRKKFVKYPEGAGLLEPQPKVVSELNPSKSFLEKYLPGLMNQKAARAAKAKRSRK